MQADDAAPLRDMLYHARKVADRVQDVRLDEYSNDEDLQWTVEGLSKSSAKRPGRCPHSAKTIIR
jgi:hypothetical protein